MHHTKLFLTIHEDAQGTVETHMTHMGGLLHRRHRIEHFLLEDTVAREGIDCEIADTKRCQVLEEVRAL